MTAVLIVCAVLAVLVLAVILTGHSHAIRGPRHDARGLSGRSVFGAHGAPPHAALTVNRPCVTRWGPTVAVPGLSNADGVAWRRGPGLTLASGEVDAVVVLGSDCPCLDTEDDRQDRPSQYGVDQDCRGHDCCPSVVITRSGRSWDSPFFAPISLSESTLTEVCTCVHKSGRAQAESRSTRPLSGFRRESLRGARGMP